MKKFLGQHFLKNKTAIERIVAAIAIQPGETIIEIGPGFGALTKPLAAVCAQKNARLIAIERDAALARQLTIDNKQLTKNVEIILGDALRELPRLIQTHMSKVNGQVSNVQRYALVGNIPYYITGHLLRIISGLEQKPARTVLMVQKEVAQRVCSDPPHMNLLAAATQIWAKPTLLFSLKPNDFDPPPEVDSSVISLTPTTHYSPTFLPSYYSFIKIAFKQPRKLLINNLLDGFPEQKRAQIASILAQMGLPENIRAQDLSIEMLQKLSATFMAGFMH